jgi:hypothetical protein
MVRKTLIFLLLLIIYGCFDSGFAPFPFYYPFIEDSYKIIGKSDGNKNMALRVFETQGEEFIYFSERSPGNEGRIIVLDADFNEIIDFSNPEIYPTEWVVGDGAGNIYLDQRLFDFSTSIPTALADIRHWVGSWYIYTYVNDTNLTDDDTHFLRLADNLAFYGSYERRMHLLWSYDSSFSSITPGNLAIQDYNDSTNFYGTISIPAYADELQISEIDSINLRDLAKAETYDFENIFLEAVDYWVDYDADKIYWIGSFLNEYVSTILVSPSIQEPASLTFAPPADPFFFYGDRPDRIDATAHGIFLNDSDESRVRIELIGYDGTLIKEFRSSNNEAVNFTPDRFKVSFSQREKFWYLYSEQERRIFKLRGWW